MWSSSVRYREVPLCMFIMLNCCHPIAQRPPTSRRLLQWSTKEASSRRKSKYPISIVQNVYLSFLYRFKRRWFVSIVHVHALKLRDNSSVCNSSITSEVMSVWGQEPISSWGILHIISYYYWLNFNHVFHSPDVPVNCSCILVRYGLVYPAQS